MMFYLWIFVNEIKGFVVLIKNIFIVKNERLYLIVCFDSGVFLLFYLCGWNVVGNNLLLYYYIL